MHLFPIPWVSIGGGRMWLLSMNAFDWVSSIGCSGMADGSVSATATVASRNILIDLFLLSLLATEPFLFAPYRCPEWTARRCWNSPLR